MWVIHISNVNTVENISVPERKQIQYDLDLDYLSERIALTLVRMPGPAPLLEELEAEEVHAAPNEKACISRQLYFPI